MADGTGVYQGVLVVAPLGAGLRRLATGTNRDRGPDAATAAGPVRGELP